MGLFSKAQVAEINKVAQRTKKSLTAPKKVPKDIGSKLQRISQEVEEYFKDSQAILITSKEQLHDYVTGCIQFGYAGIDTETTGLDRINDWIVGASLYYPGAHECYIPMRHLVPIFDQPYKGQLSYDDVSEEFQRLVDNKVKLIFANADFDLAMIYKDLKVDLCDVCYYDVILAWRCIKENEKKNRLKELYMKYVMKGQGDPKKFSDFFTADLFPYCKPEVAKLYGANDAKITYELFEWQLPYITKDHPKCKKHGLERIADLVWDVEFPLIKVCQQMHRTGIYLDKSVADTLRSRYHAEYQQELEKLKNMVQNVIDDPQYAVNMIKSAPFHSGKDFNPDSQPQVKFLLYSLMKLPQGKNGGTGKEILTEMNLPITKQIVKVRSLSTLIGTFVDKMPNSTTPDSRIHAQFKQIGADCIVGDSIIPTSEGYYTIEAICESSGCMEAQHVEVTGLVVVNKDQIFEDACSVIRYTDYPTIKITTEMGFELEGTYNHPIMVSKYTASDRVTKGDPRLDDFWEDRYFKKLEDVSVGDFVEIPCNYDTGGTYQPTGLTLTDVKNPAASHQQVKIPDTYDEAFAEFLGMYHADGSAYLREGTYTLSLSNDDEDVITRYRYLAKELFNVGISIYDKQKDAHEVESYINCIQLKDIDRILSHGKQHKKIPQAIWISPKSVINAYIRGMTLDSSVYIDENDRVAFELSICDDQDAKLVQMHLASQGILCHKSWNDNKGWISPRLVFNADNYMLFRDIIGFIESKKIRSTRPCFKNQYCARRIGDSFRVKVKKIEESTNTVYDLHVPNTHSFVSNGLISHNTGRMSSAEPNVQNIPSHAVDIRHMFCASPGYVMLGSDYSQQEPKITGFVSSDPNMIKAFQEGKDIYATIASIAFNVPYEKCLEFHPDTHEYQPDGKARRGEAKTIVLGICYGRSVNTIGEQLYGTENISDKERTKKAQKVYDSVLLAFPNLRQLMTSSQNFAKQNGYVETILGRRRHLPDMQLPEFQFEPLPGYVNPDVDPLNINTLHDQSQIPERIQKSLLKEFKEYKWFGQIVKRTKQLEEEHIKVINNTAKITDATRQCVNSIIQGSAADMTKMALLRIYDNEEFRSLGARILVPVHDEIIVECPRDNYKRVEELLSKCMEDAGDFLPFPISCDVEITRRWYGLSYPCPYPRPNVSNKNDMTKEEIKWIQYHIVETEVILPTFKDKNGEKPRGDAAKGVNGIWTDELQSAIDNYCAKYRIDYETQFITHIERVVEYGEIPA